MSLIFKSLQSLGTSTIGAEQRTLLWTAGGQFTYTSLNEVRGFINAEVNTRLDNLETNSPPTIWPTKRTLSVTGPVTGSVQMDGSSNVTLNLAMADGALSIAKVSGLQNALNSKLGSGETAAAATKLATGRAFSLTGVITAPAVNFDGSGNVALATAIANNALSIAKTSGLQAALDGKLNVGDYGIGSDAALITNFDTVDKSGIYTNGTAASASSIPGLPRAFTSITLIHSHITSTRAAQIAFRSGENQVWSRRKYDGIWSDWVEHYHSGNFNPSDKLDSSLIDSLFQIRANLGAGVDLNTVVSPGIYHQTLTVNATTALNYPVGIAGMLTVNAAATHVYQTYHVYASSRVFARARYGATWSSWAEQHTTDSFNPAGFMNTTWTLTAGNGLSGGGTGAANRTISLGTPSAISSASTNSVTTSSHTHAMENLSEFEGRTIFHPRTGRSGTNVPSIWLYPEDGGVGFANNNSLRVRWDGSGAMTEGTVPWGRLSDQISLVAGNGLSGGGVLSANRTISLGTPGTLSGSTTNSVTASSHTHALSSNLTAWDGKHPNNFVEVEGSFANLVTDYDAITGTGLYRGNAGVVGAPIDYSTMISLSRGGNRASQVALTAAYTTNRMYIRTLHDTWNNWSEVWHSDNFNPGDYTPTGRSISAGNGLSGGGNFTANRSISLGTPGTITNSTTNSVSTSSHTHALSLSVSDITGFLGYTPVQTGTGVGQGGNAVKIGWNSSESRVKVTIDSTDMGGIVFDGRTITAGNGLSGGGTLGANRTISLGTPGTITNSTSNSVTATSHTHALSISKSDVGLSNVENIAISTWNSSYHEDARGAARAPSYYTRRAASWTFHDATSISGNPGGDTYTSVLNVSPWTSYNSGHRPQQLAFMGTGGLAFRYATSDTAWSGWQNIAMGVVSASDDANTIAMRNGNSDIYARLFRSTYADQGAIGSSAALAFRNNNSSDNYIRFVNSGDSVRSWLGLGTTHSVGFQDVLARGYLYCGQANGTDTSRVYGGGSGNMFIVAGNASGHIYFRPRGWSSTNQAYIHNNGTFYASDFQLSSDRTLKHEIKDLEFRGRLRPRHFRWRESGKDDFGFIAQEVQQLYPEAIGLHEPGESDEQKEATLTVSYPKLTAVLAHQVNRLEDERDELREEVSTLREEVSGLRQEVDTLKQLMLSAMRQR